MSLSVPLFKDDLLAELEDMEQETLDEQLLDVEPTASLAIDDLPEVRESEFLSVLST